MVVGAAGAANVISRANDSIYLKWYLSLFQFRQSERALFRAFNVIFIYNYYFMRHKTTNSSFRATNGISHEPIKATTNIFVISLFLAVLNFICSVFQLL